MKLTEVVKSDEKVVTSDRFELVWQDIKQAVTNSLLFASPLLLIALLGLQEGKSWNEIKGLVYGAALQLVIDLVRKYLTQDKYVVSKK